MFASSTSMASVNFELTAKQDMWRKCALTLIVLSSCAANDIQENATFIENTVDVSLEPSVVIDTLPVPTSVTNQLSIK